MRVGDLVRFKHVMPNDALFIITRVNVTKIKSDNSDYLTVCIWNLVEGSIAIHHSFLQVVS